jgi:hypothetical protein
MVKKDDLLLPRSGKNRFQTVNNRIAFRFVRTCKIAFGDRRQ